VIKSRRAKWVGNVARMGERRNTYKFFVEKFERKRPLGIRRRRWEDIIGMNLRGIGW
jgi:hypothetical protein